MLDCDPLGTSILLECATASSSDIVNWYWTQNVSEAGVSGTAILSGNTSSNYQVTTVVSKNNRQIRFTVSESTLGYYWCEISNAVNVSLRPSTITPVCPPMSCSQHKKCNRIHVHTVYHNGDECAEENSPTTFSRLPLPTSCVVLQTSVSTTNKCYTSSTSSPIPSSPIPSALHHPSKSSSPMLSITYPPSVIFTSFLASPSSWSFPAPATFVTEVSSTHNTIILSHK